MEQRLFPRLFLPLDVGVDGVMSGAVATALLPAQGRGFKNRKIRLRESQGSRATCWEFCFWSLSHPRASSHEGRTFPLHSGHFNWELCLHAAKNPLSRSQRLRRFLLHEFLFLSSLLQVSFYFCDWWICLLPHILLAYPLCKNTGVCPCYCQKGFSRKLMVFKCRAPHNPRKGSEWGRATAVLGWMFCTILKGQVFKLQLFKSIVFVYSDFLFPILLLHAVWVDIGILLSG